MTEEEIKAKRDELADKDWNMFHGMLVPAAVGYQEKYLIRHGFDHGYALGLEQAKVLVDTIHSLRDMLYDNPDRAKDFYNQGVRDCKIRMSKALKLFKDRVGHEY